MQSRAHQTLRAVLLLTTLLPWTGCSNSNGGSGNGQTGGASTGSGGSAPSSGGQSSGGQVTQGSGGVVSGSGGQTGSGGNVTSAGGMSSNGRGGSTALGGGQNVAGRNGSGGASTGQGGSVAAGGAKTDAGASNTAGAAGAGATAPSAGCGKPASLMNGRATIDAAGKTREYILALPSNYDPNHAYRLIFGWHPWGGSAQQVASGGYYGLQSQSNGSAIFVAAEGLDFGGNGKGWGNSNGEDIALLTAMLDRFRSELCIDENRIFSTGFSFGGMFSFAAGCSSTSMMRAIAPMAGNTTVAGCENGTRPVAMMGFHGVDDQVVAIDGGRKGRDIFAKRNGCSSQTVPAETTWCNSAGQTYQPCSCVSYEGCMQGYPVTWCEYKGQHMPAPNSAATLWAFFSQF